MIADIKALFDFFLDKSKSIGYRLARFITFLAIFLIVDYSFNITYNIYTSHKLSNLETINNLKPIYKNDSSTLTELNKMESRLLSRKHYFDIISFNLSKIDFKSKNVPQTNDQTNTVKSIPNNNIRSKFWMILSSNFFFVLLFPFFLFLPIYNKEKQDKKTIFGWFASLTLLTGLIALITWIAYQIPIFFNKPILSYVVNFIIHIIFLTIFSVLIAKATDQTKTKKN